MTTEGWVWDSLLDLWWHPQTYVVIADEDMPWELVPRCTHQARLPRFLVLAPGDIPVGWID